MGRILQIRVSAHGHMTKMMFCARGLGFCAAVWPELDKWAPVGGRRGVMELAEALPDVVRFGGWPEELKTRTAEAVRAVAKCREGLVQALADWKPEEANRLSDSLEEALDTLEKLMPTDA